MNLKREQRTFVALPLPASLREKLGEWRKVTQNELPFRKWLHPEDIHITLQFLGSTSQEQLERINQALRALCREQIPFELSIDGLGTFGKSDQPRIFWAGVGGQLDELRQLQKKITTVLTPIGFLSEDRPYKPHITLARKYASADFDRKKLTAYTIEKVNWTANRVVLYESIMGQKPMYQEIGTFSFVSGDEVGMTFT